MTKLIIYVKGGLGDIYPVVSWFKEIKEKYKVNDEDVKLFVDSVYLIDSGYKLIFEAEMKNIIHKEFDTFEIIPRAYTSAYDTNYPTPEDRRKSPEINKIKNDFMFYRNQSTKEYMKKQLTDDCIFLDFVHTEQAYIWSDGEYRGKLSCERIPLYFEPNKDEKEMIDSLLKEKHILVHARKKGKAESKEFFNKIIKHCENKGIKCILIGLPRECDINTATKYVIDLRGEILSFEAQMYLIEKADCMLAESSGFAYHRLYQNFKDKKTIFNWPNHLGDYKYFLCKKHKKNPNHIFFDSNEDHSNEIIKEIDKFY